jgi:aminoglycoside 2'-N-acetyltransferase I
VPGLLVLPTPAVPASLLADARGLMDEAFGERFSDDDWAHSLGGTHVVLTDGPLLLAHASVVPRVIEVADRSFQAGYVEAVATRPGRQGEGHGARAMQAVAAVVRAQHELGVLSTSARGFYKRLGWERWRGPTYVRHGTRRVRTKDEDGGIMVLRTGASLPLDLSDPICCETRPGDDW